MAATGIFRDKKAISPVVGVVMVTLLSIILAAVVGTSSLTGILQGYSTNLGIGRIDGGNLEGDTITISHNGGEPFTFKENTKVLLNVEGDNLELNISHLYGSTLNAGETVDLHLSPANPEDTGKIDNIKPGDKIFLMVIDGDQKLVILRQEVVV